VQLSRRRSIHDNLLRFFTGFGWQLNFIRLKIKTDPKVFNNQFEIQNVTGTKLGHGSGHVWDIAMCVFDKIYEVSRSKQYVKTVGSGQNGQ
jgi:hypothetical protein